jgi:mannosyltransferase
MNSLKQYQWKAIFRGDRLILPGLLVVALALRLYRLNEGMWLDEIISYVRYAHLPFIGIATSFESENNHILFTLLARLSMMIFGESTAAFRLPAVLFGVASLWALYQLGKEVASRNEALLAVALLTFSYHHIWFSQNGRGYSALLFFSLVSSWLFLRSLRNDRTKEWIVFGIVTALGVYSHLTMLFVTVGQFIILAVARIIKRQWKWLDWWKAILGFGIAALLTLLIYAPVLPQILSASGKLEASVVQEWKNPLWTAWEILRGLQIGFAGWAAGVVVGLIAISILVAGILSYLCTRPAVVGLLFLPAIIGATVVISLGHHLWPRFFYFAFGFAVLVVLRGIFVIVRFIGGIIALAISSYRQRRALPVLQKTKDSPNSPELAGRRVDHSRVLSEQMSRPIESLAILACSLLILLSALSVPAAYGPKQDFIGAMNYVQTNRQPGEAVVVFSLTELPYKEYLKTDWTAVHSLSELQAIQSADQPTWVAVTLQPVARSVYPEIMQHIDQEFILIETFPGTLNEGTVFVFRSK